MNTWVDLTDTHEYRKVWDKFCAKFSFNHDGLPIGIIEPTPSITFDLTEFHKKGFTNSVSDPITNNFHGIAYRCLRGSIPSGEFFYVLVSSSSAYQFYPHAPNYDPKDINQWKEPVLPVKGTHAQAPFECYVFWHPRLSTGIFINPFEMTLCIFGQPLVDQFDKQRLDPLIKNVKRRNGRDVKPR